MERIKTFFADRLVPIFYRVERVEYFLFAPENKLWQNEYLILHHKRRIPILLAKKHEVVNSAIGFQGGQFFAEQVLKLLERGVIVEFSQLTIRQFVAKAIFHPQLKRDPWVKNFLPRIFAQTQFISTR